jgi:hypothetical protein
LASRAGNVSRVEELLTNPQVDPAVDENMAILEAVGCEHDDVLMTLLADPRVNSSAGDNAAIRHAIAQGRLDIVEQLLAHATFSIVPPELSGLMENTTNDSIVERLRQ